MLLDAHIHLFQNGYLGTRGATAGRFESDLSHYTSLMSEHSIESALVVGYEGAPWAVGNNSYISNLSRTNSWIYPLAFITPEEMKIELLEKYLKDGFVGISLYLSDFEVIEQLGQTDAIVWEWLLQHRWIISVNSDSDKWAVWSRILERFPLLILLISHLGLPVISDSQNQSGELRRSLQPILDLASFTNVYIKLSGFYALEKNTPRFPYPSLTPYLQELIAAFASNRAMWGSDFPPALDEVQFPHTFENLSLLPGITDVELGNILGGTLKKLLLHFEANS